MGFGLVEKPVGTLDLLVYLLRHGRTSVNAIQADTGMMKETFYRALDRLKSLGFVFQEEEKGFPTRAYVGLTRAGQEVAEALAPASDLLAATARSLEEELDRLEAGNDPGTESRRIELLANVVDREFSAGRWDLAAEKARRLTELAHAAGATRPEALGRLALGRVLQKRDAHDDALRELHEAGRLARHVHADDLASDAEYLIGSDLERQTRWAEALTRFAEGAALASSAQDEVRAARARLGTGRVLARQGRLEDSERTIRAVVAGLEALRAEEELPRAYASLGSTLYHLQRPDAIEWFEKAIGAARRSADPRMEAHAGTNAAAHWIDARQFRKAESFLRRARDVFSDLGERDGLAGVELNLGNLYVEEHRWTDAEQQYDRAQTLAEGTGSRFIQAYVLFSRGTMMKRRDRGTDARSFLLESKRIFSELGSQARVARCDEELRDLIDSGTR